MSKEVIKEKEIDIGKTIKKTSEETAKKVVEELKFNRMIKGFLSYPKRVELLLYNYETLKEAIEQKEEDIKYLDEYGLPEGSKSVVIYQSSSGGVSKEDRYVELRDKYKREKLETERDIKRIENAIKKIKGDKYFDIIRLKYLNTEEERIRTDEDLAEIFEVDRITINRNRRRLINKLVTILFPQSIREVM